MSIPPPPGTEPVLDPSQSGLAPIDGDALPAPGQLQIKGRRSWATWQLLVAVLAAIVLGFWLNGTTQGSATESSSAPAYKLPTSSGATTTTAPAAGGSTTTTTAAGGSTTSTTATAGGSTTQTSAPAAAGPARVLLGPTQMRGNWTSPAFTTTAA